jgi:hypothetical protein
MNYPARYQHLLDEHGVILDQLGLADVALEATYALKAIEILREERLAILGGDVFFKRENQVEIAYANWHADKSAAEPFFTYAERSCVAAMNYISRFPARKDAVPLFTLVVQSDNEIS